MRAFAVPDVTLMEFTPPVIPTGYAGAVRFEAAVTEAPASVAFEYDLVDRPMYDDGTHGDQVAGDGKWTIEFTASEILSKNTTARVFRPFIGYCKPAGAGKFNIFAEVWTSAVGLANVRSIDAVSQETDYVMNFVATKPQILGFTTTTARTWAQKLYATKQDRFDFLNFLLVTGTRGNRYHFGVRNDVTGIGSAAINNSALFGSAGRLKGCSVFPLPTLYDGAGPGFNHETGHQWINYLSGTALAGAGGHFAKGNAAINVMGFGITGSNAGGTYTYTFTPNGSGGYTVGADNPSVRATFNSLELYLAGLAPASEVGTYFSLVNQNQTLTVGQVLTAAEVSTATINDIIAAKGARVPASTSAQKTFRSALIILSPTLLDAYSMSLYDWFTRRSESRQMVTYAEGFATGNSPPWYLATGSRSVMFSKIADDVPAVQAVMAGSNSVQLSFAGKLGISYQPQGSNDLVTWTDIGSPVTPVSDSSQSVPITAPGGTTLHKFYRLVVNY